MKENGFFPLVSAAYGNFSLSETGITLTPGADINMCSNGTWLFPSSLKTILTLTLSGAASAGTGYLSVRYRNGNSIYTNTAFAINTTVTIQVPIKAVINIIARFPFLNDASQEVQIDDAPQSITINLSQVMIDDALLTGKGDGTSASDLPVFLTEDSDNINQTYIRIEDGSYAEKTATDVWDGTIDASWYDASLDGFIIQTAAELAGLAQLVNAGNTFAGKIVTLVKNIRLNNLTSSNGWQNWDLYAPANTWISIDGFEGIFDGANCDITGLYANPLFGHCSDCAIRNVNILSSHALNAPLAVAYADNCTLNNVRVNGYTTGTGGAILGGTLTNTSLSGCSADGTVQGNGNGGLAYWLDSCIVQYSWVRAWVYGTNTGMFCYDMNGTTEIRRSYALALNSVSVASVVNFTNLVFSTITNSYIYARNPALFNPLSPIPGLSAANLYHNIDTSGIGTFVPSNSFRNQSSFPALSFGDVWGIDEGVTLPYLLQNQSQPLPRAL